MFTITSTKEKLGLENGAYWLCPSWIDVDESLNTGLQYDDGHGFGSRPVFRPSPENSLEDGTNVSWLCVAKNRVYEIGMRYNNSKYQAKSIWESFVNAPR